MFDVINGRLALIYAIAVEVLGHITNISQALSGISTFLTNLNLPGTLASLQTTLEQVGQNQLSGFATISTTLAQLQDSLRTLQFQVGQPQQAGIAVRLPTTPPAGYGGLNAGAVADAVWFYHVPGAGGQFAGDVLASSGNMANAFTAGSVNVKLGILDGWMVRGGWNAPQSGPFADPDPFDVSLILPTDASVTAFLNRLNPGVYTADVFGRAFVFSARAGTDWTYTTEWGQLEFDEWKRAAFGGASVVVPPVWPGLANVTLGTSVALADQQVVAGPMDGVIVHLTSVPASKTSYFFATTEHDWFRIGAITFRDDHGDEEPPQLLGFDHAVYCARTMQHASSALIRLQGAVTGTVQPWTIT